MYIGEKNPISGCMFMGSELTVTPQEQDLRVLTDPSKRKLIFFGGKTNKMVGIAKKGLENKESR